MNPGTQYLDRPIFITGFNKSGTTLLLSLLDNHPQLIVFPEELHFFNEVLYERDKSTAIREKTGFRMLLPNGKTERWSQGKDWFQEGYPEFDSVKFNQLVEQVLQTQTSDKDLLLRLIKAFAEVDNLETTSKLHWVSKTPQEELFFPVMVKMFGKSFKMVYLVRDPRDVYLSYSERRRILGKQGIRSTRGVINFCVYWKTQINRAMQYHKNYENICIIRYEDLLTDATNTLGQLCNFLEIDYSPELLRPTRHGKPWEGNSVFSKGFRGLSKEPVGRFKEILRPEETFLIGKLLSKELVLLGYYENKSRPAVEGENSKVPWFDYWITSLKYQRWYFFKQFYSAYRYGFSGLH